MSEGRFIGRWVDNLRESFIIFGGIKIRGGGR